MAWIISPVIILIAVVLLLIYYYGVRTYGYWKKRGIPYVKPVPFFGNLMNAFIGRQNPAQVVCDIYDKYPDAKVIGMWNLRTPALLLRDPELIQKVLVADFNNFANNEIEVDPKVDPVMASNMFCQKGEAWRRTRQMLSPAFTASKVKTTYEKILEVSDKLVKFLETHPEELQVKDTMGLFTSEIVANWGMGVDCHSFSSKDPVLPSMGKLMFDPTPVRALILTFAFLVPKMASLLKIKMIPDEIGNFFEGYVSQMVQHRNSTGLSQSDFLQYFIEMKKKRSGGTNEITDDDVTAGMVAFFIEGYETSSMVSSFLLYHLAMNSDVQKRLREEVEQAVALNDGKLTFDVISELKYMEQCFAETNRMHAALGSLSKVCTQQCTLYDNFVVDPGISVVIPLVAVHMDPKYWSDPESFNPDRFTEESKEKRRKDVYLPFGLGPRMCIGSRLAQAVIKTAAAKILLDFDIVPSPRTPPKFEQSPYHMMSSQKGGLYLKFVKRTKI